MDKIIHDSFSDFNKKALERISVRIIRDLENFVIRTGVAAKTCVIISPETTNFCIRQGKFKNTVSYPTKEFNALPDPFTVEDVVSCVNSLWISVPSSPEYQLSSSLIGATLETNQKLNIRRHINNPISGWVTVSTVFSDNELFKINLVDWLDQSCRFFEKFFQSYKAWQTTDQETDQDTPSKVSKHN